MADRRIDRQTDRKTELGEEECEWKDVDHEEDDAQHNLLRVEAGLSKCFTSLRASASTPGPPAESQTECVHYQ